MSVVRSHAAGTGAEVETEVVRAMMFLRLATMATGGTGVRPETAATYAELLNACQGALGCAQDAYSLRCAPAVHGGARDTLAHAIGVAERGNGSRHRQPGRPRRRQGPLERRAPPRAAPATSAVRDQLRRQVPGPGPDRYLAPEEAPLRMPLAWALELSPLGEGPSGV
jgi:histidine ammonia-lyase